ncbi:hypothetical protein Glove_691g19 [Diversispora epigaea]|uniref:Zn(2)-C6 fungal-type domain-containing protein n=1 Tax=Diversispora epigaea TaxID=1348612 RepID=A0A397GAJ4_9GLOM|nr:hypothetical protein Glove_691g19 [Diversispora epigaea]
MYHRKNNSKTAERNERKKVTNACKNCRKRKSKCSGRNETDKNEINGKSEVNSISSNNKITCDRCLRHGLRCEFIEPSTKRGPPKGRDRHLIFEERNKEFINNNIQILVRAFNSSEVTLQSSISPSVYHHNPHYIYPMNTPLQLINEGIPDFNYYYDGEPFHHYNNTESLQMTSYCNNNNNSGDEPYSDFTSPSSTIQTDNFPFEHAFTTGINENSISNACLPGINYH